MNLFQNFIFFLNLIFFFDGVFFQTNNLNNIETVITN
jgi:hypothetical protein